MLMIGFHIVAMFSSLIWPYLFSYFATFITNRISFVGDTAYNTSWFDYPLELQKHFILIIARSQEDVHFTGFNLVRCTLEVFGKVWIWLKLIITIIYWIQFSAIEDLLHLLYDIPKLLAALSNYELWTFTYQFLKKIHDFFKKFNEKKWLVYSL